MEKDLGNVTQAHGLTHNEMEELHLKQVSDDVDEIEPNNGGDNIGDPYFKNQYKDHKIFAHEKHLYHVLTENRQFLPTGAVPQKTSFAVLHKFTKEAYEFQKSNGAFNGQIVHILHNPSLKDEETAKANSARKADAARTVASRNQAQGQGNAFGDTLRAGKAPEDTDVNEKDVQTLTPSATTAKKTTSK